MKVKQHTLQSFEFLVISGDEEKIIAYLTQNEPLILGNTVILSTEDETLDFNKKIIPFLIEKKFCYLIKNCNFSPRKRSVLTLNKSIDEVLENFKNSDDESNFTNKNERIRVIVEKPIRSGSYIATKNDLTILNQVNGGAEIESEGNIEIFGTISGKIICNGTYMLIRDINDKGLVIFNGIILDKEKFKNKKAKLIKLNSDKRLFIEEL